MNREKPHPPTPPTNAGRCDYVRVCSIDVSIGMMAQRVLVNPGVHGCTVEEVVDATDGFPHPWLVSDSEMAAK